MKKTEATLIAESIAAFLNDFVPKHKTQSFHTRKSYEDALALYLDFLDSLSVKPTQLCSDHFKTKTIEEWLTYLIDVRGNKPETRNVRLSALREFLKYLGREKPQFLHLYIESKAIPRLPETKRKIKGMPKEAVKELLHTPDMGKRMGRRDAALLTTMYSTAARLDEILSLRIRDLHLDASKPYIQVVGKGMKTRPLYLLPQPAALIQSYLEEFHGDAPHADAYVFFSRNVGPYGKMTASAADKMLKKHSKAAHEVNAEVPSKLRTHQLRHAKASHWLEDGMNIVQISFLLGHESLETTMKYLDITTEQEMKALATLEDETTTSNSKKWRKDPETLRELCGLSPRKN